jgi:hypothetical protein
LTLDDIRDIHHARPFKPFVLHLADGRKLNVMHPEFLAYASRARTLVFVHDDGRVERVNVLLVTSAEELPDRRGKGKRRKAG